MTTRWVKNIEGEYVPESLGVKPTEISKQERELPEFLVDFLLEASGNISKVISFFELQKAYLSGLDPDVKKFIDSLKEMNNDLIKKRVWIRAYRIPPWIER